MQIIMGENPTRVWNHKNPEKLLELVGKKFIFLSKHYGTVPLVISGIIVAVQAWKQEHSDELRLYITAPGVLDGLKIECLRCCSSRGWAAWGVVRRRDGKMEKERWFGQLQIYE